MAKIEVDEEDFARYQKTLATLQKINADPEGKKLLQRAHKKVDPTAKTPDIDEDEKQEALKSDIQKEIEALKAERAAEKAEADKEKALATLNAKFEAGRQKLKDQRYTPEGIEAVEKFMNERGIPDHEIAAAYLEKQNPPQEIMSPRAFGGFNFTEQPKEGEDKFLKALLESKGDNDGAVLGAAVEAVSEIRSARR